MIPEGCYYTDEQYEIIDRVAEGGNRRVIARAGAAKTSMMGTLAEAEPHRRFLYTAFNKKPIEEARGTFPSNVRVVGAHQMFFPSVGRHYKHRIAKNPWSLKTRIAPRFHTAYDDLGGDPAHEKIALYAALAAINAFCASRSLELDDEIHVANGPYSRDLVATIARGIWNAMVDLDDDTPITPDVYLKIAQIKIAKNGYGYNLDADCALIDEGQDYTACMMDIIERADSQKVIAGDPFQAIYSWRGAIDGLSLVDYPILPLTRSFRFGPEIAAVANDILRALGEDHLIVGGGEPGIVGIDLPGQADTVIARTNMGLIDEAIRAADDGALIYIVGDSEKSLGLLRATSDLLHFGQTPHHEIGMFPNWAALKEAVETPIGRHYRPYVRLVERHRAATPQMIGRLTAALAPMEKGADVILTTLHAAKGQAYNHVRLADDFPPFCEPNLTGVGPTLVLDEEEAHVAYVAVTRARKRLDLGGFSSSLQTSLNNVRHLRTMQAMTPAIEPTTTEPKAPALFG